MLARPRTTDRRERPGVPGRGAHLAVLWAFALVEPLFRVLKPEFFFDALPSDAILFAIAITFIPPIALLGLEALVGLASREAAWRLHLALLAGLGGIVAAQLLARVIGLSTTTLVIAAACGAGFALAYAAAAPVRLFVTVLTPAVPLFLVLFLFTSSVSKFMLEGDSKVRLYSPSSRTPVVVLVFDELPVTSLLDGAGRFDAARFPNFAAFARSATWFKNATTVHDSTFQAVPAIMTGTLPRRDALPIAFDRPNSIFTLLGGSYRVNASETAETHVCPERVCPRTSRVPFLRRMRSLFREGARVSVHQWLPSRTATDLFPFLTHEPDPPVQARRFIRGVRASRAPSLQFLHIDLPHMPWHYAPSGKGYPPPETDPFVAFQGFHLWPRDPGTALGGYQRHLLQVEYTDRVLGQVLASIRRAHLYGRALIVVLADHGVAFRPGEPPRVATPGNAPDILSPPLIVKAPGQRTGQISERFVRTVDVLPTIAATLHMRLPFHTDGRSVFAARYPDPTGVGVMARDGRRVTLGTETFVRRRAEALRTRLFLFGSGSPSRVYWIGANADLLGRTVESLHAAGAPPSRVALDSPHALASVDLTKPTLPLRVTGTVSGSAVRSGTQMAVAVNGRLVAATPAYAEGGRLRFAAMVPEGSLRDGRNALAFFAVLVRGGQRAIERLAL